ncbi:MAG: hypothetical protein ABGY96_29450 [bacterium]|nr:hypothetical protein [Gammaproteobacteria bacterium]HIL98099.1 hypothetical protein [Pseudomonadales bacterium]
MLSILSYFWQMCLLRTGPEKIPRSITITSSLVVVFLLIQTISVLVTYSDIQVFQVLILVVIEFIMEASIIYGLLRFKNVAYRFLSALSAVLGSNAIFICMLLAIHLLTVDLEPGWIADFLNILALICFFWWLAVFGFILSRSAGISMLQGTVLAFIIELVVVFSTRSIFPPAS